MEYAEVARATSERGEIVLRERHDPLSRHGTRILELRVNGAFVMDTLETGTEQQLAAAALAQVDDPRAVVVGGLGLGFTLREVLADHRVEKAAVVEIEDALVQWMRDGTIPHGPAFFADQRLNVVCADIRMAMAEATPDAYDLILLDVDNGPGYLVYEENAGVYEKEFLDQVRRTLRQGGAVAVWSADRAPDLAQTLDAVFGNVETVAHDVRLEHGGGQIRTEQYWLYLARR